MNAEGDLGRFSLYPDEMTALNISRAPLQDELSLLHLGEVSDAYDGCCAISRVYGRDRDSRPEPSAVAAAAHQLEAAFGLISPP